MIPQQYHHHLFFPLKYLQPLLSARIKICDAQKHTFIKGTNIDFRVSKLNMF